MPFSALGWLNYQMSGWHSQCSQECDSRGKKEHGGYRARGLLGVWPAKLGFQEGPVCRPHPGEAPILFHGALPPHGSLLKLSCTDRAALWACPGPNRWISQDAFVGWGWRWGGSIITFKFQPCQCPARAPCPDLHRGYPGQSCRNRAGEWMQGRGELADQPWASQHFQVGWPSPERQESLCRWPTPPWGFSPTLRTGAPPEQVQEKTGGTADMGNSFRGFALKDGTEGRHS